ncbi:hypothetical protein, partial [Streptomyces sp. MBT97]|uniref:hypothetical protein n=1 Tax=Streptomyces sp. MBT97 TaxID=2800411 RepID=UPI001F346892
MRGAADTDTRDDQGARSPPQEGRGEGKPAEEGEAEHHGGHPHGDELVVRVPEGVQVAEADDAGHHDAQQGDRSAAAEGEP